MLSIPEEIGRLNAMTTLDLSVNRISELPAAIGGCVSMVTLRASENRLTELPAGIGNMPGLRSLMLKQNALSYVHPAIGNCGELLEVRAYSLSSLSRCVSCVHVLEYPKCLDPGN
jgi:Leucine-rich repeat (LRR) protein